MPYVLTTDTKREYLATKNAMQSAFGKEVSSFTEVA